MRTMDWKKLIADIQASGLSQEQIAKRLDHSQAWASAVAAGKFADLKWRDGEKLIALHRAVVLDKAA